jgi:bifunctional UDP-N-acetylglucosamine pyrophosphorylase/glucosamine-1-phosphate N-acetyltransferase
MTGNKLAIIVLAAGQGTRMRSRLPKVLHPIGGRPLVGHVLTTATRVGADHIEVVVRHERDQVVAALTEAYPAAVFVDQDDIPGTGRAVQVAIDQLPADFDGDVLVLSGDCPLADADTLSSFLAEHRASGAPATLMTAVVDDPTGYGRVIRDVDGGVDRIVE